MPVSKRSNDDAGGSGGAKRSRKEAEVPTLPVAATPPSVLQPPKPPSVPAASPKGKKGAGKKAAGDAKAAGAPTKAARKPRATSSTSANNPAEWMRMYGVLKRFMTEHGDTFPTSKDTVARDDGSGLHDTVGLWCIAQRERRHGKRAGIITPDQIEKLDTLGFDWDAGSSEWDRMFGVLKKWVAEHDGKFPKVKEVVERPDGSKKVDHLGTWCVTQRQTKKKAKGGKDSDDVMLSPERVAKLNAIGFDWDPLRTEWMRMYGVLKKWLKDHGGKFPKAKDQIACADGTIDHIGTWCVTQRQTRSAKRKGKLTNEQIKLLDDLGFTWSPNKTKASGAAAAPASASAAPASAPRAAAAPPASKGAGKGPQPAAPPAPK